MDDYSQRDGQFGSAMEQVGGMDARQDHQTVTPDGALLDQIPAGVTFREATTHVDYRGSLVEMFDERWDWSDFPLVYSYCFTLRPGMMKGWGMHRTYEDRYFNLFGEVESVLYDDRPDSPTRGLVTTIVFSEFRRRLMNIPPGVWHAHRNIGDKDAVMINFPTKPYDHANPDKYRLPLDTDQIPHQFRERLGE